MPIDHEKLAKMQAQSKNARIGGKGTARRKKKIVSSKNNMSDDKRIATTLKKFSCSKLPGIDEVNMFKEDGTVIHFKNPSVTASPTSNTFTIAGHNEVKKLTEIPGVLNQLGLEGLQGLQQWAKSQGLVNAEGGPASAKKSALDDIPETGNFDEVDDLE